MHGCHREVQENCKGINIRAWAIAVVTAKRASKSLIISEHVKVFEALRKTNIKKYPTIKEQPIQQESLPDIDIDT